MHRKDMEAGLAELRRLSAIGGDLEQLKLSPAIVEIAAIRGAWTALEELLSATRWRKTDEEPPEKRGAYLVHLSGGIYRCAWWMGRFEIDARPVKPVRWLPIPEVSPSE